MSSRYLTTARLANILQMIGLARQSGILRVVRGHGAAREVGQIRFTEGEPSSALLGQLTGPAALSVLENWGECQYAFTEATRGLDGRLTTPALGDPSQNERSGVSSDHTWSAYDYGSPPHTASTPSWLGSPPHAGGEPAAPSARQHTPLESAAPRPGSGYAELERLAASLPVSTDTETAPADEPHQLRLVPERASTAEQPDQLPLDRRERMVLLLVDGQRSIADLIRLTNRSESEVLAVLNHLTQLGLVRVPV